ncbi:hypothetical protein LOTGIDRAFT_234712 [Lottia gigantea]|uniref:Transmembrane protein 245 n=1 Tax=Lottia gigantea TaxID=225164 RepID=V4A4G4_LOTGI|nr:hypothetical protein LOTGIDRAFT_234712 [Lottia gigantea]ESO88151.1 hypothetical protein LOTGIDRAFT_234712 [Lottia gigantea]
MTSPSEYLSSVWQQYVPQGHEKALKQAVYTTASNFLILVAIAAVISVYFILEAFLRPLLWAVLCGTFLYPLKRSLTNCIVQWMKGLKNSGTPIAVGVTILPLTVLNNFSNKLGEFINTNFKTVLSVAIGLPLIYLVYHFGPLQKILSIATFMFWFLYDLLDYFSSLWIWTIFIAYILVLIFFWTPESHQTLSYLSIPVWVIFTLHIATIAGSLRVPLLIAMIAVMITGFITEVRGESNQTTEETESEDTQSEKKPEVYTKPEVDTEWTFKRLSATTKDSSELETTSLPSLEKPKPSSLTLKTTKAEPSGNSLPNQCFIAVLWGHILVRLWMHLWVILLFFVLPLVIMLFKKLGAAVSSEGMMGEKIEELKTKANDWFQSRKDVLVPRSVRGLIKLALKGDGKIISVLETGMDKMTSILLILALVIGTIMFTVVGVIQIHQESMLMVSMTSTLLNDTLHPEISQWLPDQKDMSDAMDSMVGNAYIYGRDWIVLKVRELVDDGQVNSTHIEQQVLEVWDTIFNALRSQSTVTVTKQKRNDLFDMSSAVAFVQENIGVFMSVWDSVWSVIKGNMNLVSQILSAIISMILGGGTAILNFVLSAVIFLTTLFYLLASSGKTYKPVEWFTSVSMSSGSGSGFGQAVEEAISSVFMASLKMSAFYGFFTWLTHVVLDVDIVFIPSVMAAVFGAVPFVGTYWAAFPGALELWVLKGEGVMAIMLIVIHMLPAYIVDTAIYSEIKGGHPFMTGLAIAGGMYCLGLEGAFIGPILLCCLIVVVNMYGNILHPETSPSSVYNKKASTFSM